MKLVKKKSQLKWEEIANFLKISRPMIFFYLNGHSKIPKENYQKLCSLVKIKPFIKKYIEITNKTRKIKKPSKITSSLAELIGSLAGDGHISNINYEIAISGHIKLDKEYLHKNISKIFKDLFEVNVKNKEHLATNNLRIVINSKELVEYLTTEFKLPIGKKKGRLHIPKQIKNTNKLLKNYIKGLFDTDGSVYLRRGNSLVVSIISRDPNFLEEIRSSLIKLGYDASVSGKNLYIYKQDQIRRFFFDIQPNNQKHKLKYDNFINKLSVQKLMRR